MTGGDRIARSLESLRRATARGAYRAAPVYDGPIENQRTPFRTLVGCLISTRTRDQQTTRICERLFREAPTAAALARLSEARLRRLLYGAGFYRQKAVQLRRLARLLVARGEVPRTRAELLALPGIGPKCANIVLAACFDQAVIAVDTHVHRISNRLGWVRTTTPEQTEARLTPKVPRHWRAQVNLLLVAHGQLVCKPIGPLCASCVLRRLCAHPVRP
jgi:endonuclease-3